MSPFQICTVPNCYNPARSRTWCSVHYDRHRRLGHFGSTPVLPLHMKPEDRFWTYVKKSNPNDCWLWTGHRNKKGYGKMKFHGLGQFAHRISFFLHNGFWPMPFCLHSCDNPSCVNPAHLRAGDAGDKAREMWSKDRADKRIGSHHPNAKLTETDVIEIRSLLSQNIIQRTIAVKFDVSIATISLIKHRKFWTHI